MGSLVYIPHIDLQHTAFSPIASVCQRTVDFTSLRIMWREHTVDREIFALKIIRPLNFRVKNISSFDGSAM